MTGNKAGNKKYIVIALLSLSILATELFWTRLFSAEFFYTFAFLILSLAILGLGLGALVVKIIPALNKHSRLYLYLTLAGLMIILSVPSVFMLNMDFTKLLTEYIQLVKLIAAIIVLGSGYFLAGIALSLILKTNSEEIPSLYMADFIGASAGVLSFIIVMNNFGADVTLIFCAVPILCAAYLTADKWLKTVPVAVLAASLIFLAVIGGIPEQKREERAKVIYRHWDATAKIKIYEFDSTARGINIDNAANTPVLRFDGNWNIADSEKVQFDIDVRNLMTRFRNCRFLSLGSGGGEDVLQALQYNASEVHAVEVIPHINYLLKEGNLKDFSGNIYNDSRVKVITEDARVYIRQFKSRFDVIYSLSSNTFAAFASGSFALAENYIFTTEAFMDYWNALSDSGFLSIEHQFYAPRLAAEVLDALNRMNIPDPKSHFAVYNLPALRRKVLLVSKLPLTPELIQTAYANSNPAVLKTASVLFPSADPNDGNIINTIVQKGWRQVADTAKIDVSPCTDNRPFIAQLGLLRNLENSKLNSLTPYEFTGFPISRLILIVILFVCLIIIVPLNVIPYLTKGPKLRPEAWLYFFFIGIGYMMAEVVLIQKYTLFIGSTIYSLALVLTVLLVSSGLGSKFSGHFTFKTLFLALLLWTTADILLFNQLFYFFSGSHLFLRLIISAVLIAPVGFLLGMPFPMAASKCSELVEWAFAVNGSASVIGSVVVVLIATSHGYAAAQLVGTGFYALAALLYRSFTSAENSIAD